MVLPPFSSMSLTETRQQLVDSATAVLPNAHAPYSQAPQACALLTDKGTITGVTVENCASPNSICAVRAAVVNAVSSGMKEVFMAAVAGEFDSDFAYPCGQCSEQLAEIGDFPVILVATRHQQPVKDPYIVRSVCELVPGRTRTKRSFPKGENGHEELTFVGFSPDANVTAPSDLVTFLRTAIEACELAYCPYSAFPVGAALRTDVGVIQGANVEAKAPGCTLCAERTAFVKAISDGAKEFIELAVVCAKANDFGRPCGACRQSLVEFGDFPVHMIKLNMKDKTFTYASTTSLTLLPGAFLPSALGK